MRLNGKNAISFSILLNGNFLWFYEFLGFSEFSKNRRKFPLSNMEKLIVFLPLSRIWRTFLDKFWGNLSDFWKIDFLKMLQFWCIYIISPVFHYEYAWSWCLNPISVWEQSSKTKISVIETTSENLHIKKWLKFTFLSVLYNKIFTRSLNSA